MKQSYTSPMAKITTWEETFIRTSAEVGEKETDNLFDYVWGS